MRCVVLDICLLLVLGLYMCFRMCCRTVYDHSVICIVSLMPFHAHIYVSGCFSAVTDVSVDYLTSFYNMLIFMTNYILSTLSFHHFIDSDPCILNPSLTNHMPLEMKYFLTALLNHTYFLGEKQIYWHSNEGYVDTHYMHTYTLVSGITEQVLKSQITVAGTYMCGILFNPNVLMFTFLVTLR